MIFRVRRRTEIGVTLPKTTKKSGQNDFSRAAAHGDRCHTSKNDARSPKMFAIVSKLKFLVRLTTVIRDIFSFVKPFQQFWPGIAREGATAPHCSSVRLP